MQFSTSSSTIFVASSILFILLLATAFIPQYNEAIKVEFYCDICKQHVVLDYPHEDYISENERVGNINIILIIFYKNA